MGEDMAAMLGRHRVVAVRWRGQWTGEMYQVGFVELEDDDRLVIRGLVLVRKTDGTIGLGGSSTTIDRKGILEIVELKAAPNDN